MTFRYLAVVLLLTAVGAGLLGMRQQQLNDKHAIAEHHAAMKQDREQIKDFQVRIARLSTPEALQESIERARLEFEPISRQSADPEPATAQELTDG